MSSDESFFTRDVVNFFRDLSMNNTREWFHDNKERYEASVLEPSKRFVVAMGERLGEIAPDVIAVPRVNRSLFRLNRDVRFSRDKSPYKTQLGIYMWQGTGPRMENPGFYFHIEPGKYMAAVGMYMFPPDLVEVYRKGVDDDNLGPELVKAVDTVEKRGYHVGDKKFKRVPGGYPQDHERAEFLKYGGLYAMDEGPVSDWVFTDKILEELMERYEAMLPVHQWVLKLIDPDL